MANNIKLEIIVSNVDQAQLAQESGADRLEVCTHLACGGLTSSIATIKQICKAVSIPVMVMLRPKAGPFIYSMNEQLQILADAKHAIDMGASGIVAGSNLPDGQLDEGFLDKLMRCCEQVDFTYHRAFDVSSNPTDALNLLIKYKVPRLLTSGTFQTAWEGRHVLKQLLKLAESKIIIMPGSGIKSENIAQLHATLGAKEYHTSAKKIIKIKPMLIDATDSIWELNANEIINIKKILHQ